METQEWTADHVALQVCLLRAFDDWKERSVMYETDARLLCAIMLPVEFDAMNRHRKPMVSKKPSRRDDALDAQVSESIQDGMNTADVMALHNVSKSTVMRTKRRMKNAH